MRGHTNEATSAVIGLLIGITVFTVVFYVVVDSSIELPKDAGGARESELQGLAERMSDTLFAAGSGWYGSGACDAAGDLATANFTPDQVGLVVGGAPVGRFGLAEETCDKIGRAAGTNLSFAKFDNLYNALTEADPDNGYVDYEEARASLQLSTAGYSFHVRSWPILPSVRTMLSEGQKDPYMKALYIGDYTSSAPPKMVQHTKGAVDGLTEVTLYVHITNNGTTSAPFGVGLSLSLDRGDVDLTLHTRVLAPGQSQNVTFKVPKTADWEWDDEDEKWAAYTISDKDGVFQSGTIPMPMTMTHALTQKILVIEADKLYFTLSGGSVSTKIRYASYDGEGRSASFTDWTYVLENSLGLPVAVQVLPNEDEGTATFTVLLADTYTAKLLSDLLTTLWNSDTINAVASDPAAFGTGTGSFSPGVSVAPEVAYVDAIIDHFDPGVVAATYTHPSVPYAAGGDVYPDLKAVLDDELPLALQNSLGAPTLSKYTTILVGSNVDHNAMTSTAAKITIRDWVFAGGTLIVLGSDQQNVNWLQPIFHSSLDTASGGLSASDTQHPALHVPNDLDYQAFEYTTEWGYGAGWDDSFTHVVTAGSTGDLLAVGEPGAFGDGRVLLSSWRPYDLTGDQAANCALPLDPEKPCQALFLIHNLVTLTYRQLYLDYGPALPLDESVGSARRIANVWHPELDRLVAVHVQVFVF